MARLWHLLSYPFRRGPRRPFAERRPEREDMGQVLATPLGMEATDIEMVDRVARQNDALERTHAIKTNTNGSLFARSSTHINPMPEDETYAAQYHRAYNKKDI